MAEEAAGPRQRIDAPAVEPPIDEFGEIFAAGTIAASQREGVQDAAKTRER